MNKNKVYVTGDIPGEGLRMLRENFEVEVFVDDAPITEQELKEKIKDCDGLVAMVGDPVTREVIEKSNRLKIIANYGVGYDNIDVDKAREKSIEITNTPGVLHEATADLTFSMILSLMRRTFEADNFLRAGKFKGWKPQLFLGKDIYRKKLGIVGLGEIGEAVAKRARGFDMEIFYNKRTPLPSEKEKELGVKHVELSELIESSDIISLHVPLTTETHHLITKKEFSMMKEQAVLINTSRGPVVKESDLVKALEEGEISGAALDVFEDEPEVHSGLIERDDCILVPHIGSATRECRAEMGEIACKNVLRVLQGESPLTPVI